jgi:hypothetical protein
VVFNVVLRNILVRMRSVTVSLLHYVHKSLIIILLPLFISYMFNITICSFYDGIFAFSLLIRSHSLLLLRDSDSAVSLLLVF